MYPKATVSDGGGHEELSERDDGHVRGQADGGGAMKVIRHGQGEPHLHDRRYQQQFEGAQANDRVMPRTRRNDQGFPIKRARRPQSGADRGGTVRPAETTTVRSRQCPSVPGLTIEARSALDERQADGGDDEDTKEGHLKAGGERAGEDRIRAGRERLRPAR
jgi:hypothetical protein